MKGFGVIISGFRFQYSKHKNCCFVKDAFCDQGVDLPTVSTEMCVFLQNAEHKRLKSAVISVGHLYVKML
jgi:hypothetical protein